MKTLPAWKLKREAQRLAAQTFKVVPNTWEYLTLSLRYDHVMSKGRKCHTGRKQISSEAAIYLIFPVNGVLKSNFQMLEELAAHDITPIVISNQPLSPQDLESLKEKSALVIERPNVGYDFGGYRDAILELEDQISSLTRLYVLNDSVWMLDAEKSWFQAVRDAGTDFCGATSNYGIRRYSEVDFREIEWEYTPDHWNFHYASYAFALGHNILQEKGFLDYWKKFRLSNNKKRTVRRGEIGLSKWIKESGYTHSATCDVHNLDKELQDLDPQELENVTRHLIIPEKPRLLKKRNEVLESDPHSSQGIADRIKIILTAVSLQAMGYAMPYYTIKSRGFQFIKKSPLWLSSDSSKITLQILQKLDGPMGRQAFLEAQEILKERKTEDA